MVAAASRDKTNMQQTTAPLAHEVAELKIALNISFRRLTELVGHMSCKSRHRRKRSLASRETRFSL